MGDLSPHFSAYEFACKCGCGFRQVVPELLDLLEEMRAVTGGPLRITSGCRCPAHNESEGGVENSTHTLGEAADVTVEGGWHRFRMAQAAFACGAEGVGVAKTFVHVDVHKGSVKPRPSAWSY